MVMKHLLNYNIVIKALSSNDAGEDNGYSWRCRSPGILNLLLSKYRTSSPDVPAWPRVQGLVMGALEPTALSSSSVEPCLPTHSAACKMKAVGLDGVGLVWAHPHPFLGVHFHPLRPRQLLPVLGRAKQTPETYSWLP